MKTAKGCLILFFVVPAFFSLLKILSTVAEPVPISDKMPLWGFYGVVILLSIFCIIKLLNYEED